MADTIYYRFYICVCVCVCVYVCVCGGAGGGGCGPYFIGGPLHVFHE